MKILVTGAAGFIGSHVADSLAVLGYDVVGLDSLNNYYDVGLKYERLEALGGIVKDDITEAGFALSKKFNNYRFIRINTQNREIVSELFRTEKFDLVCHLAAQPGVRYSIENPYAYIDSNINGFITILEGCRRNYIRKLVYASSSSVYGDSSIAPFLEEGPSDEPVSLYAATKKANELMAYTYSHLYHLRSAGLRLFTVYGPWGRPDMAPFLFIKAILKGEPIKVFNSGDMYRDFTYIDDVVEGIVRVLISDIPYNDSGNPHYDIYNIGNQAPVGLSDFISNIEDACGRKAIIEYLPMQPGDVHRTYADVSRLSKAINFIPDTPLQEGIEKFTAWYLQHYSLKK